MAVISAANLAAAKPTISNGTYSGGTNLPGSFNTTQPSGPNVAAFRRSNNIPATNPNGNVGVTNSPSGTSSTATAPAPTPALSPLTGQFNDALNSVMGYYNQILGGEPQAIGSAQGLADQGYEAQKGTLNNSFAQAQAQVPWQLVGRGAGNSSWADNANEFANNAYKNNLQGINTAEAQGLDQLQQQLLKDQGYATFFNNTEAPSLQANFQKLDPYYQSAQIAQLMNQGQQLAGQEGANLPVNQLAAQINSNPTFNQSGSGQISNLEAQLANTGAPTAVQNQILGGLSANNPLLPNVLTNLQPPSPITGPAGA